MKRFEYLLSIVLALAMFAVAVAWTHASHQEETAKISCKPGSTSAAVVMKGLNVYPRCNGGKRG